MTRSWGRNDFRSRGRFLGPNLSRETVWRCGHVGPSASPHLLLVSSLLPPRTSPPRIHHTCGSSSTRHEHEMRAPEVGVLLAAAPGVSGLRLAQDFLFGNRRYCPAVALRPMQDLCNSSTPGSGWAPSWRGRSRIRGEACGVGDPALRRRGRRDRPATACLASGTRAPWAVQTRFPGLCRHLAAGTPFFRQILAVHRTLCDQQATAIGRRATGRAQRFHFARHCAIKGAHRPAAPPMDLAAGSWTLAPDLAP